MSQNTDVNGHPRQMPRCMSSTDSSRASKATRLPSFRRPAGGTPQSSPISKRQHVLQRATERLASLRVSRARPARLPISSPVSPSLSKEPSLRLPTPSRRLSHIPHPVKKDALPSPTEKPLPSIPVATFVSRSPVQRRSLLDATEKPLRRSVSPGTFEDWPTLSPVKAYPPRELPSAPKMVDTTAPVKSSLGESVNERMRKLDLNVVAAETLSNARNTASVSKAHPQNHTPKTNATPTHSNTGGAQQYEQATASEFLDPRPAPETPRAARHSRNSVSSTTDRRSSLHGLSITKTRSTRTVAALSDAEDVTETRQPSSRIAQPSFKPSVCGNRDFGSSKKEIVKRKPVSNSAIPRPLRTVTDTGSPCMTSSQTSPKVIQLKRAQGQVADMLQKQNRTTARPSTSDDSAELGVNAGPYACSSIINQPKCDVHAAWALSSEPACSSWTPRSSSLPVPISNEDQSAVSALTLISGWMQASPCEEDGEREASTSSSTTVKKEPISSPLSSSSSVPTREASLKENIPPSEHDSDEELSPVRNGKGSAVVLGEADVDDCRSDLTRVTSVSSASKAGTIYAQDERGGYRLKPVSNTDPKHGPRVRIQDSADDLLLSDEQLAQVEAKREAYKRRLSQNVVNNHVNRVMPELESLQYASSDNAHPEAKTEEKVKASSKENTTRLAPPVPANIGTLSHSSTGWPILVSKIAPFAEVDPSQTYGTSAKRKSASESNLRGNPGTPVEDGPGPAYESSPGSAYTLRTALRTVPRAPDTIWRIDSLRDSMTKGRKSLPNIADAISKRPLFPARTSSKVNEPSPLSELRTQTSVLLESYVDQRAHFPHKSAAGRSGYNTEHSVTNGLTTPSQLKHIRTYNTSLRHLNAHQDIKYEKDIPSSPIAVQGTVHTGKAKMMSTMRGLMHKISKEGGMTRSDSKASVMYHSGPRQDSDADNHNYQSSPLALRSPLQPDTTSNTASKAKGIEKAANAKAKRTLGLSRLAHGHGTRSAAHAQHGANTADDETKDLTTDFQTSALEPLEIRDATALAFNLLDQARDGTYLDTRRQTEYVELAKMVVSTVTLARDAEKAMEEAKQAAARAEIGCVKTRQAIADMSRTVRGMVRRKEEVV